MAHKFIKKYLITTITLSFYQLIMILIEECLICGYRNGISKAYKFTSQLLSAIFAAFGSVTPKLEK